MSVLHVIEDRAEATYVHCIQYRQSSRCGYKARLSGITNEKALGLTDTPHGRIRITTTNDGYRYDSAPGTYRDIWEENMYSPPCVLYAIFINLYLNTSAVSSTDLESVPTCARCVVARSRG